MNSNVKYVKITRENLADNYCVKKMDNNKFPLTYQNIDKYQQKDKYPVAKLKLENYHNKYFCGGVITTNLICLGVKMVMPMIIQKYIVNWYNKYLLHPGMDHTEATISQNYY